ncbi:MAG TPA: hypothetical protein VGM91_08255 [Conexibacter sp.]|jgi:hypothetical protein
MSRRIAALAAASGVAVLIALPSSALALSGGATRRCYSHLPTKGSEPLTVQLSGGTPGADYIVSATVPGKGLGSAGSVDGTFDAAGNALAQIPDVFPPNGTIDPTRGQKVDLSVADYGAGGTDVPLGDTLITNIALDVANKPTAPTARRAITVSGSPFAGKRVYGFVVKGSKSSRVVRRIPLGSGNVCGYASAKQAVVAPHYALGTYRLYVNAGKKLNKSRALAYQFSITRHYL